MTSPQRSRRDAGTAPAGTGGASRVSARDAPIQPVVLGALIARSVEEGVVIPQDRAYNVSSPRPQTHLLTLFGRHVDSTEIALSSTSLLAVLDLLGVSTDAARSTLSRMTSRGYLQRHRRGRNAYFSLTSRGYRLLVEGRRMVIDAPTSEDDGTWTLLSFSVPESQRSDRHNLRTALSWRGFGLLRNGLWIAPGCRNVGPIIAELGLEDHVEVFAGQLAWPNDPQRMVSGAWDLDALEEEYRQFCARWDRDGDGDGAQPLVEQLLLLAEWRILVASDPRLPRRYLPSDWPGLAAHALFLRRHNALNAAARAAYLELADQIEVTEPTGLTSLAADT